MILLRLAADLPKKPIIGRISDFWPYLHIHYPWSKWHIGRLVSEFSSVETQRKSYLLLGRKVFISGDQNNQSPDQTN